MRILFVLSDLFCGGAEYQIRNIISVFAKNGEDVYLALRDIETIPDTLEYRDYLESHSIPSNRVICIGNSGNNKYVDEFRYYVSLYRFIRSNRINSVFVYDKYGIMATPLFSFLRLRMIYSERNSGEVTVSHKLYIAFLKKYDIITCNSSFARNILETYLHKAVLRINNTVDEPQSFIKKQPTRGRMTVLVSARISPEKNQLLVIKALCSIAWGIDIRIVLAGKTSNQSYLQDVLVEIENSHIETNSVELKGFVFNKEELYSNADVVILPSFTEGTPNVVLECFARKIPILASSIPQNEELIQNQSFLFNPESVAELRNAFSYFLKLEDKDLEIILEANYKKVKEDYIDRNGSIEFYNYVNSHINPQ